MNKLIILKYMERLTKDDIVKLAKKIKENTIYILSEAQNERN